MANRRRGEVPIEIGGRPYILCLTLGALAELETAFGAGDLAELGERFASGRVSGRDLLKLLAVALRGGGHDISDAEVAALPLRDGLSPVVAALGEVFVATFGDAPEPSGERADPRPFPGTT